MDDDNCDSYIVDNTFKDRVADLVMDLSLLLTKDLAKPFGNRMVALKIFHFWKTTCDIKGQNTSPTLSSQYLNMIMRSFNLLVNHGGLGDVVLCKNKWDGRQYDVKKIQLKGGSHPLDDKIKYLVGIANNLAFLVLYPSGGRAY
ncbi:hypothetical protein HanPI659440_Chr11g0441711 [Helianthus annuus]|nr:hypothetical protein HanPI659440_Chr11g0441711 [Helianthus annuus]